MTSSGLDPERNCLNCPSYVPAEDDVVQRKLFGRPMGMPMCSTRGTVLSGPKSTAAQRVKIGAAIAKDCIDYGKGMKARGPGDPLREGNYLRVTIAKPDLQLISPAPSAAMVPGCGGCNNYVDQSDMYETHGIAQAVCGAYGRIIPRGQAIKNARDCPSKWADPEREHFPAKGLVMLPWLSNLTVIDADIRAEKMEKIVPIVDPAAYESEIVVSDAHKALGIRAWQTLHDPEDSGNTVLIPIFDRNYFDANQQLLIPLTGDDEHPEEYLDHQGLLYKAAVLWIHLDETPALHGVAGTGKTEFYRYAAWRMQLPFDRVSITKSTELEDIIGKMHFSPDKGTYFTYGRIPQAWPKPGVMCIDEPNVGQPDVWQAIRPLTDNAKVLRVDANGGEVVERNAFRFMGMAMNPAWDYRNVGAEVISDADGSRLMHIFVEIPEPELERQIILRRCKVDGYDLPESKLNAIMAIAGELRALGDSLSVSWGIRPQLKVARASRYFNLATCYKLAVSDYLEPDQQQIIKDQVMNHAEGM